MSDVLHSSFGIRHSSFFRPSSFGIRHFDMGFALDHVRRVRLLDHLIGAGRINRAAAAALNAQDADDMRDGFRTELFNSRGVHGFTSGEAERALAENYRVQAAEVERDGFHRLATTLRDLAASYERQSERESVRDPLDD